MKNRPLPIMYIHSWQEKVKNIFKPFVDAKNQNLIIFWTLPEEGGERGCRGWKYAFEQIEQDLFSKEGGAG